MRRIGIECSLGRKIVRNLNIAPCIKVLMVIVKTDEVGVLDLDEDSGPKQVTTFPSNPSGAKDASR